MMHGHWTTSTLNTQVKQIFSCLVVRAVLRIKADQAGFSRSKAMILTLVKEILAKDKHITRTLPGGEEEKQPQLTYQIPPPPNMGLNTPGTRGWSRLHDRTLAVPKKRMKISYSDIPSSYAKILGENLFQPREFLRSG